jgi:uncharacterized membrane protein YccC
MTVPYRPAWLAEIARMAAVPVPWPTMAFAALAIGVPLLIGVLGGQLVPAVLISVGAILALMVDRAGPYPLRVRRLATVGAGAALGFVLGIAINGHGWPAVGVLVVVATISAVLSSINAIWSSTGLWLLVAAVLATGPLGTLKPWWHTPLWVLVGVGWWILLMLPGWLRHPRVAEQRYVAAVYTALAADLRADPNYAVGPSRQGLSAALNTAYAEVLNQRAADSGPSEHLQRLVTLLGRARLIADTLAALHYAKEQPPPEAATQAQAIAEAVLKVGGTVTPIEPPTLVSPQMVAVYELLNQAADVVSRRWLSPDAFRETGWSRQRPDPHVAAQRMRHALTSTFTIRLTLCVGVAAIFSETLPLQRSYWVVLAVAVVMKPDYGSVFARTLQYAAGTVIGAIVAALILIARPSDAALLAPVIALAGLAPYGLSRNYWAFCVFFTPLVILLVELVSHGGWHLGEARLLDILLGCGVTLLLGYLPWPSSWHADLPGRIAETMEETARYLNKELGQSPSGTGVLDHAHARMDLFALRTEFQRTLAEPPPFREPVVAWYPTIVALDQLLDAISATIVVTGERARSVDAVQQFSERLRQLASAVGSGCPFETRTGPPRPPSLELVSDALRSLEQAVDGSRPGHNRAREADAPLQAHSLPTQTGKTTP